MRTILYAQPYDREAEGFYFQNTEEYTRKVKDTKNSHGHPVEEFEIQFIDSDLINRELANAWGLNQANLSEFFEALEEWDDDLKTRYIIAVGECGYAHDQVAENPENIDLDIYQLDSLRELAEQFVDEGLFGEIPKSLEYYIDYDAIARDLSFDYCETEINGARLIYRIG